MEVFKNRRRRIFLSLAAALAFTAAVQITQKPNLARTAQPEIVMAWWGTMYPDFCFSEKPGSAYEKGKKVKISFWLAKHLDW